MPTQYLSGRTKLDFPQNSITSVTGGQFTTSQTRTFTLIGQNRAGFTLPSDPIEVNQVISDAIVVNFPSTNRTEGTDFHYYWLCLCPDGTVESAVQIAGWKNYEADQVSARSLPPIVLVKDAHLEIAPLVSSPEALPTGNDLVEGMVRAIALEVSQSAYYRYDPLSPGEVDGDSIIAPTGRPAERWFKIGSPYLGVVDDPFGEDGCARAIRQVSPLSVIKPPKYSANAQKSTPIKVCYYNDTANAIALGTTLGLTVFLNGVPKSQLFDGKILLTPKGYVNFATGELDTSNGVNVMPNVGHDLTWFYGSNDTLVLPKDLPSGWGYFIEIAALTSVGQLDNQIYEGDTVTFNLVEIPQSGTIDTSLFEFTGNLILPSGDRLHCVPGSGLSLLVGTGAGVVERMTFPLKPERQIAGVVPQLAGQRITVDGNGALFYRGTPAVSGDIPGTEAIRAIVGCEQGHGALGAWRGIELTQVSGLSVTLNYPCNSEGMGIVREDYPAIAGDVRGYFNVPFVVVYLKKQGIVYSTDAIACIPGVSQVVEVSALPGVISSIPSSPSSLFSLWEPPSCNIAAISGTLGAGVWEVAARYFYNGGQITSISHRVEDGCIEELDMTVGEMNKTVRELKAQITGMTGLILAMGD
ncbi:MAG TPA: hypothetical protein V6D33_08930 [Cyanophyceae cyanobacterium]